MSVTLQRPFAQFRFSVKLSLNMSFHIAGTLRGTPLILCKQIHINTHSSKHLKEANRQQLCSWLGERNDRSIFPRNMTNIQSTVWGREIVARRFTDFSQRWKMKVVNYTQYTCNILHSVSENSRVSSSVFLRLFFTRVFRACIFGVICVQYSRFTRKKMHSCDGAIPVVCTANYHLFRHPAWMNFPLQKL